MQSVKKQKIGIEVEENQEVKENQEIKENQSNCFSDIIDESLYEGKEGYKKENEFISFKVGKTTCIIFTGISIEEKQEEEEKQEKEKQEEEKQEEEKQEEEKKEKEEKEDKFDNKIIDLTGACSHEFTEKKVFPSGLKQGKCNNLEYFKKFIKKIKLPHQLVETPRKQIGINLVEQNMSVAFFSLNEVNNRKVYGIDAKFQKIVNEDTFILDHVNKSFGSEFDCMIVYRFIGDENLIRHPLASSAFDSNFGSVSFFFGDDRQMSVKQRDEKINDVRLQNEDYFYMPKKYINSHYIGISPSDDPNNTAFLITFKKFKQ